MATTPKLSICVPSRNRQYFFQKTIEGMLRNPRKDVQFVFADNSDDPAIMNEFVAGLKDPRVIFLPSVDRTLSMLENWERTVAATTGDWVTVVGDDDHCEPDVIDVINTVRAKVPDLDAFAWGCISFLWPVEGEPRPKISIMTKNRILEVPQEIIFDRMFRWQGATHVPVSGFSIYHSAVSRSLLERIKKRYGGSYFEHPNVDYDMAMKVIVTGRRFVFCERPFSIMGSCPKSNSFSIGRAEDAKKKHALFFRESRRNTDEDEEVRDFPFQINAGLTAIIGQTQQWFKSKYKVKVKDWGANFAKACAKNTEIFTNENDFNESLSGYADAFSKWESGRYLKYYRPEFMPIDKRLSTTGFTEDAVYVAGDIADIKTPAELFDIVNAVTCPAKMIDFDPPSASDRMKKAIVQHRVA